MRRGPNGERRSGDVAQVARRVFQIAIGEEKEEMPSGRRRSGLAGAQARKASLTREERRAVAKKAAAARWAHGD